MKALMKTGEDAPAAAPRSGRGPLEGSSGNPPTRSSIRSPILSPPVQLPQARLICN